MKAATSLNVRPDFLVTAGRPVRGLARLWRRALVISLVPAALPLLSGCGNSLAQRRIEERRGSMEWVASCIGNREATNGERLQKDVEWIGNDVARNAEQTGRNIPAVDAYFRSDFERFGERLPAYGGEIERVLRGKTERFDRTAIVLFL